VPGQALHPTGSLFYQPLQLPYVVNQNSTFQIFSPGGIDVRDVNNSQLRERVILSEPLLDAGGGTTGAFLTVDENGGRLFALTQSGLTVVQLSLVPLSIGSVQPNAGPASGGTLVTLRGSGFVIGISVRFGNSNVSATVTDTNTLTFTTPVVPIGTVAIGLTKPDGSSYMLDAAFAAN
jgi:hypothetical protein